MCIATSKKSLILSCAAALASTGVSATEDHYGPLRSYAQSPIQSVSLAPVLRSAQQLPQDYTELYGSITGASVWADTENYSLDYYHNQLEVGGKWALSDKWLVDVTIVEFCCGQSSGWTDRIIS